MSDKEPSLYFGYEPETHLLFVSRRSDVLRGWVSHGDTTRPPRPHLRERRAVTLSQARKLHPELDTSEFEQYVDSLSNPHLISDDLL